jgi:hypothetical protein
MPELKPKAVLFGAAVDILGSIVISVVAFAATAGGRPLTEEVTMQERFGTFGLALMIVAGLAQTGLGGFAAAQMARVNYVLHGVAVGVDGRAIREQPSHAQHDGGIGHMTRRFIGRMTPGRFRPAVY